MYPDEIENAIHQLAIVKQLEAEAKALKSQAAETLTSYMRSNGIKSLESDHCQAKVSYTEPSTTSRFSKTKAKQNLLSSGVLADVIEQCFSDATEQSERAGYVTYTPYN